MYMYSHLVSAWYVLSNFKINQSELREILI